MSVYNGENFVEKCIDSITKQTFKNFEFLILDDGLQIILMNYLKKRNLMMTE